MDRRRAERQVRAVVAGGSRPLDEQGDAERVLARPLARRRADASTPDATSTPTAGIARRAPATLAGSRPPARVTGTSRAIAAASRSEARVPVPPGMRPAGGVERGSGRRRRRGGPERATRGRPRSLATGRAARRRQVEHLPGPAPDSGRGADRLVAAQLDGVRVEARRCAASIRAWSASAVIATTSGRWPPAPAVRASRGEVGRLVQLERPRRAGHDVEPDRVGAGARRRRATPAASVTPQIFTNGRRATLAGSSGGGAGGDEGAGGGGRVAGSHERLADERAVEPERAPAGDGPAARGRPTRR